MTREIPRRNFLHMMTFAPIAGIIGAATGVDQNPKKTNEQEQTKNNAQDRSGESRERKLHAFKDGLRKQQDQNQNIARNGTIATLFGAGTGYMLDEFYHHINMQEYLNDPLNKNRE